MVFRLILILVLVLTITSCTPTQTEDANQEQPAPGWTQDDQTGQDENADELYLPGQD